MKSFIFGILGGLGAGMIFAAIISANDDKVIANERSKAEEYHDKYWEGNRQIALYDDDVRQLKKIIKKMTNEM